SAMEEHPLGFVFLALAADHELVVFDVHGEIGFGEASDCQRNAQAMLADLLDVVGGIAFRGGLVDAVEHALDMVEAQQKRARKNRHSGHRGLLYRARAYLLGWSAPFRCRPSGAATEPYFGKSG